jgi:hypothetical protein
VPVLVLVVAPTQRPNPTEARHGHGDQPPHLRRPLVGGPDCPPPPPSRGPIHNFGQRFPSGLYMYNSGVCEIYITKRCLKIQTPHTRSSTFTITPSARVTPSTWTCHARGAGAELIPLAPFVLSAATRAGLRRHFLEPKTLRTPFTTARAGLEQLRPTGAPF